VSDKLDIHDLENHIYAFLDGVLPTLVDVKEAAFGWSIRFTGYALQKAPLHIDPLRRNQCWARPERSEVVLQYPINDDGSADQEVEFIYKITLESKQTNATLSSAATYAHKLLAHRDGYKLFEVAGISKFEIKSHYVRAIRNTSVFFVDMILKLRAVITLSDIKICDSANCPDE
jgi:hypothetical protein